MGNLPYEPMRYFAVALDPVHVGTGGFRLGRVDMSIVREPGTNIPKIPGTSLAGACRTYAAMRADGKFPRCAGQGQVRRKDQGHCGEHDCPICVTFGFSRGDRSFQGLAQFFDARLVFYPVHSLAGPVWVTCADALRDWKPESADEPDDSQVRVGSGVKVKDRLNLGWLMLQKDDRPFSLESLASVPKEICDRVVLVSTKLFSQIVNDNLEVRTSVSIDPATGAAAEGALYTYEALPRASVLGLEVMISEPKYYQIETQVPVGGNISKVKETVIQGLALFENLGVGGMNTRGMGRLRVLGLNSSGPSRSTS